MAVYAKTCINAARKQTQLKRRGCINSSTRPEPYRNLEALETNKIEYM